MVFDKIIIIFFILSCSNWARIADYGWLFTRVHWPWQSVVSLIDGPDVKDVSHWYVMSWVSSFSCGSYWYCISKFFNEIQVCLKVNKYARERVQESKKRYEIPLNCLNCFICFFLHLNYSSYRLSTKLNK